MVIPSRITNYNRSPSELQEFAVYCVAAAGKRAEQQASKVSRLIEPAIKSGQLPLDYLADLDAYGLLGREIESVRLGQYARICKAVRGLVKLSSRLASVSVAELESIYGIGPKTSRFFVLHSRQSQSVAVLDTHILSFLRKNGISTPSQTPSGKRYLELESAFIRICDKAGLEPAAFDLHVWNSERGNQ